MSYKTKKKINAILGRKAEENLLSCVYCSRQFVKKLSLEKHEELHRTDPDSKALREGNIDESLWAKSKAVSSNIESLDRPIDEQHLPWLKPCLRQSMLMSGSPAE